MFRHDDSFEFPVLKQVNLSTGRVYKVVAGPGTGSVYPSITRVLYKEEKQAIREWKERVGHEEAQRIAQRASFRGTKLHGIAERFLGNRELPEIFPNVMEIWRHLHPWLTQHITCVYGQETDVFSTRLGVAGRFDLLADVDDELSVVDFKQSNKPKKEEWLEDYYMQGTFYSLAVYELTGKKVKRIIFPVVNPDGLQLFETKPLVHFTMLRQKIDAFYASYEKEVLAS